MSAYLDTGNTLFETVLVEGRVDSSKRHFLRARIEVWRGEELVLSHDYDSDDREMLV